MCLLRSCVLPRRGTIFLVLWVPSRLVGSRVSSSGPRMLCGLIRPLEFLSFPEHLVEWQRAFSQSANEMTQGCESSSEFLRSFDVGWLLHPGDGLSFLGVRFDSSGRSLVSGQLPGRDSECALLRVELDPIL